MKNIQAKIIAHSQTEEGHELVSYVLRYPRFIHAELMTHREFSRNAASSRAIPVSKMLKMVWDNPAVPEHWGSNNRGMQSHSELGALKAALAKAVWRGASKAAVATAYLMNKIGMHKQIANRVLETFGHIEVVVTTSRLHHFFALRAHPDAQPEFQVLAQIMLKRYLESTPKVLQPGEAHIPQFVGAPTPAEKHSMEVATARCARLSYLTFDGEHSLDADLKLHDVLAESGHWSPFEHCATAVTDSTAAMATSNFGPGWVQYRSTFSNAYRGKNAVDLEELHKPTSTFSWLSVAMARNLSD